MNDLTGAFLIAHEKGEDPLITRQSLANAGYPIPEIDGAFMEFRQVLQGRSLEDLNKPVEKKSNKLIPLILLFVLIVLLGITAFFFREKILGLFGGN